MSTLTDKKINRAKKVWFTEEMLYVLLEDGREIGAPIEWFPKLRQASKEQLSIDTVGLVFGASMKGKGHGLFHIYSLFNTLFQKY
ncbi:DUF2442 domain-containing protein [Cyclobacterium sp.]|uniref:DUF2442 domain-containing protein n=1 Tax=Cyclobacterium sp. TaxID=1966343 RepID=UPI0019CEE5D9|nr:DUF2442 domain-containing protein [Cyclobacterium sp.]MBD3627439.1 DUF2442 domain-containing protein [Cyclobacterium sp.]